MTVNILHSLHDLILWSTTAKIYYVTRLCINPKKKMDEIENQKMHHPLFIILLVMIDIWNMKLVMQQPDH